MRSKPLTAPSLIARPGERPAEVARSRHAEAGARAGQRLGAVAQLGGGLVLYGVSRAMLPQAASERRSMLERAREAVPMDYA